MQRVIELLITQWRATFEILLLAAIIYYFLLLFRGTRGAAVFTGFVIALLVVTGLTRIFELDVMNWILSRVLAFLAIGVLIIFQPELRRALAQLGSQPLFSSSQQRGELISVLVETARALSQKHFGGLIAIEREIGFRGLTETGVAIDAKASTELLTTIFHTNTPLHDGGVVLRGDRVVAAGCVFPLTQQGGLSTQLGMRHRAAIGLSEETDAIILVVSEETGQIGVARRGHLLQDFDANTLRTFLANTLAPPARTGNWFVDRVRKLVAMLMTARSGSTAVQSAESVPHDHKDTNG
ncbi:MAG: Cyclic di-AMP synthase CdaA [Verrucomicrobiae bacterium]|nr:Cyclic di-AMP synthase CdaA [Verrucomicrobiae bacterium]